MSSLTVIAIDCENYQHRVSFMMSVETSRHIHTYQVQFPEIEDTNVE